MPNTVAMSRRTGRLSFHGLTKGMIILGLIFAVLIHPPTTGLGGRPTPFHLFIAAAEALLLLRVMSTRQTHLAINNIDRAFALIFISVLLSYIFNLSHIREITYGLQVVNGGTGTMWKVILLGLVSITVSYLGYRLGRISSHTRRDVSEIMLTVVLATSVNSVVNIIAWSHATRGSLIRYGFIPPLTISPGLSASLSVVGFVLAMALWKDSKLNSFVRVVVGATLLVQGLGILVLTVRQSYVMFIITVFLYTVLASGLAKFPLKRFVMILVTLLFITLGIFFLLAHASSSLLTTMSNTFNPNGVDLTTRFTALNSAWELFTREPLFGVGYGLFGARNQVPMLVSGRLQVFVSSAHNGVANALAEMGIAGLISLFFMGYAATKYSWHVRKQINDPFFHAVSSAVLALIIVEMISQLISNSVLLPPPADASSVQLAFIYWTLIGMLAPLRKVSL